MDRRRAASLLALGMLAPILPAAALTREEAVDRLHRMPGVQVVLVHRAGELVAVRGNPERPHNIKSLSKSLLSAAAGIALADGTFDGLDQPVAELLPDAIDWDAAPAKRGIRLRHVLTMTAGLATTSQGHYGAWVASDDWVRAALERPLVSAPGKEFIYSTGNSHLLSAALARASGISTREYLDRHVLAPLGGEVAAWERDPQGVHMGGNNLSLRPRDLVAFGELYLDEGRVGDRQVVPAEWVAASTRAHSTGWPDRYGRYGYLWWIRPSGAFMAVGYGGQLLYVDREREAVVVVLSSETGKGADWDRRLLGVIERDLLPALQAAAPQGSAVARGNPCGEPTGDGVAAGSRDLARARHGHRSA